MKTIKELIEECDERYTDGKVSDDDKKQAEVISKEIGEYFNEKNLEPDHLTFGVVAGYVSASLDYQKELDHIKTQYDIKCDEKRKSDNEIARLTKIIMDAGLTEKLEVE